MPGHFHRLGFQVKIPWFQVTDFVRADQTEVDQTSHVVQAVILVGPRGRLVSLAALLLGYWVLLQWIPVPGGEPGDLRPGRTLVDWFDREWLPGRLHRGVRDPEGLCARGQAGRILREFGAAESDFPKGCRDR